MFGVVRVTNAMLPLLHRADSPRIVNAGCPGYVATDFTGHAGTRTPEQGAAIAIHLATLPDDGPRGAFFDDDGVVPW